MALAALSVNPLSQYKRAHPLPLQGLGTNSRMLSIVSCQNHNHFDTATNKENNKEGKGVPPLQHLIAGVGRVGKGLKDNLSPKQKGDWKDLTLMSLSFAVYVYMSQKIVCAYCLWMSMAATQPW